MGHLRKRISPSTWIPCTQHQSLKSAIFERQDTTSPFLTRLRCRKYCGENQAVVPINRHFLLPNIETQQIGVYCFRNARDPYLTSEFKSHVMVPNIHQATPSQIANSHCHLSSSSPWDVSESHPRPGAILKYPRAICPRTMAVVAYRSK